MLDIKFIREHVDVVKEASRKKHHPVDIDRLVVVDEERKKKQQDLDALRAQQNTVSARIAEAEEQERQAMIDEVSLIKTEIKELEQSLRPILEEWKAIMLQVPQVPDSSVPEGNDAEDNKEIKVWGEKPQFDFEAKSHIDIMNELGMVDFERGSKVHGFRGYYLVGDGTRLSWAIWNYANQFFEEKEFIPLLPPAIVRENFMYGTGHLPNDIDDIYRTQDEDYLTGTSEVAVMGYHADEVLSVDQFPVRHLAFSPCYRREAGSYGRDTKGLIRVNEFYKLEQVILCEASHEESVSHHEELNRNTEEFIESLGIPYHTVLNCGGDLGQGQVKKYDIELWVPMEETYREISSASYFHDFQARRLGIRYKDSDGTIKYAHSLNSTAAPTPRLLVSLVENYQQSDGSIVIPEVLRPFMGGKDIIAKRNLDR